MGSGLLRIWISGAIISMIWVGVAAGLKVDDNKWVVRQALIFWCRCFFLLPLWPLAIPYLAFSKFNKTGISKGKINWPKDKAAREEAEDWVKVGRAYERNQGDSDAKE